MITQTRTCDDCKAVIPDKDYNINQVVKLYFGHYDSTGRRLEFCGTCWEKYRLLAYQQPNEQPTLTTEERALKLLTELINLLPLEQNQ